MGWCQSYASNYVVSEANMILQCCRRVDHLLDGIQHDRCELASSGLFMDV